MITTQLKITVSDIMLDYLTSKANKFGLTLSSYVKNLIINDIKDMDYPTYRASTSTETAYQTALSQKTKAIVVNDIDDYFNNL